MRGEGTGVRERYHESSRKEERPSPDGRARVVQTKKREWHVRLDRERLW